MLDLEVQALAVSICTMLLGLLGLLGLLSLPSSLNPSNPAPLND